MNVGAGEIHRRHVQHAAHRDGEVLLAHVAFAGDELEETNAFLLLLVEQLGDLFAGQQPVFDESVGNAFTKRFKRNSHINGKRVSTI